MTGAPIFHTGEQQVQARLGVRDITSSARKAIRSYLPEQHRTFHTALPFMVAAARDAHGRPWATILTGPEGFITSPDPQSLVIDARPVPGDALEGALTPGVDLGLLGIELATRRRNRLNGRLRDDGSGAISCSVEQTFGNCPQYIREREWQRADNNPACKPVRGNRLTFAQRQWIAGSDTFFVASGHRGAGESPAFGMDASHRGGESGFVRVDSDRHLVFPDYAGNNYFNTFGNLSLDPRAGLLFVDFESGSLLQLTVRTTIDWDSPAVAQFPGARRLVDCEIEEIIELHDALPLRWDAQSSFMSPLRLTAKTFESEDVTSFVFAALDGSELPDFAAGQHLPIELEVPGYRTPVRRMYSLSSGPGQAHYRISVKREPQGLASRHLHDRVQTGAVINARAPAGDFVLGCAECPTVLISAGVGVTPMISMLQALSEAASGRPVWFIHGARDGKHHPLSQDVRDIAVRGSSIHTHVAYTHPGPDDRLGDDYDSKGRVDGALVSSLVTEPDAQYYLCGPVGFMADIQTNLETQGIPAERIRTESFGPVADTRQSSRSR